MVSGAGGKGRARTRLGRAAACAAALIAIAAAGPEGAAAAKGPDPVLVPSSLPLSSAKLFDVSVADADHDGDYDLFSTNHKYRGSLMLSDGEGFVDGLDASGLSATDDVPGFDDLFSEPAIGPAGLYMWVDREGFTHLRTVGLGSNLEVPNPRVAGEIRFLGREVTVEQAVGAQVAVRNDPTTTPPTGTVTFDAGPDSEVVLRARFMDLPFELSVDPTFKRSRILLGPRLSPSPAGNRASFDLGDRHGVAWADFDQDGATDAYIANGGNRGAVRRFGEYTTDELYWGDGEGQFSEDIERTGIEKGFCRGRYAAPVDYDGDGQLDIFIGCETIHPLLLRQRTPGKYGSRSHELTLAGVRGDVYRWVDLDGDGIQELISIRRRKIRVYDPGVEGKPFRLLQSLRAANGGKTVDALSIADIDGDSDADLFVASRGGNSVLLNRGGRLSVREPRAFGLPPAGSVSATFVDYDNDGLIDFHSVPQGVFRQGRDGYERTGVGGVGARARFATASWFDLEGDGDRDLVSSLKRSGARLRNVVYENRTPGGHWLEVDLRGAVGNAEAIGARVSVSAETRGAGRPPTRQTRWVGEAESSRFSVGHYRTYFGLGEAATVSRIVVRWPDGSKTKLSNVAVDRVLAIAQTG